MCRTPGRGDSSKTMLGNSCAGTQYDRGADACPAEHADQDINAEEVNLAPDEVADARLRHAEQFGRPGLGKTLVLDQLASGDHEFRPKPEILGLRFRKPEIPKHIA